MLRNAQLHAATLRHSAGAKHPHLPAIIKGDQIGVLVDFGDDTLRLAGVGHCPGRATKLPPQDPQYRRDHKARHPREGIAQHHA